MHPKDKTRARLLKLLARFPGQVGAFYLQKLNSPKRRLSRQALHKELMRLRNEGTVVRLGRTYALSYVWLHELGEFVESARNNLNAHALAEIITSDNRRSITRHFRTFRDLDDYWTVVIHALLKFQKLTEIYQWHPHLWFLLLGNVRESGFQKTISASGVRILSITAKPRGSFELMLEQGWRFPHLLHSSAQSSFHKRTSEHITCAGDFIASVQLHASAKRLLTQLSDIRTGDDLRAMQLTGLLSSAKVGLTLTVKRAPREAAAIRREFLEYFGV